MIKLGVNIDHIATLRQARKTGMPDILESARVCELAGANLITVHLREDRRHIQDKDVYVLRKKLRIPLNLEMSLAEEIVKIAMSLKPDEVCIFPEKRQEVTTEGGLDILSKKDRIKNVIKVLKSKKILVSMFIDPDEKQVRAAKEVGADCVELHTGKYANSKGEKERSSELKKLYRAGKLTCELGLILNAGHGLDYDNVVAVAKIPDMQTLNIGFSIIARSIFVGLHQAVKEMKNRIKSNFRGE